MRITPSLSTHRLARLTTWARLWLAWMASVLAQGPLAGVARRHVDQTAWVVEALILVGATKQLPQRRRQVGGPPRKFGWLPMRTLLGSALHRRLRGRDLAQRVAALTAIVRDMDRIIADVARRIASGFTNRRGAYRAPVIATFIAQVSTTPALADSS